MERSRLPEGMALLLLQALPSPLAARAEPPQVRAGRSCTGCGGLGASRPGWRALARASLAGLQGALTSRVEHWRPEHSLWSGSEDLRGPQGHLFRGW